MGENLETFQVLDVGGTDLIEPFQVTFGFGEEEGVLGI